MLLAAANFLNREVFSELQVLKPKNRRILPKVGKFRRLTRERAVNSGNTVLNSIEISSLQPDFAPLPRREQGSDQGIVVTNCDRVPAAAHSHPLDVFSRRARWQETMPLLANEGFTSCAECLLWAGVWLREKHDCHLPSVAVAAAPLTIARLNSAIGARRSVQSTEKKKIKTKTKTKTQDPSTPVSRAELRAGTLLRSGCRVHRMLLRVLRQELEFPAVTIHTANDMDQES